MINLDYRLIGKTALQYFAPWLILVLLMIWLGYPGVLCITPAAWLLSLVIGTRCVTNSASPEKFQRLLEAVLAGALYGFLVGGLFIVDGLTQFPVEADQQGSLFWTSTGCCQPASCFQPLLPMQPAGGRRCSKKTAEACPSVDSARHYPKVTRQGRQKGSGQRGFLKLCGSRSR